MSLQKDDVALSELRYDVWEIFSKYIHEGAPEKVDFPSEEIAEFTRAMEGQNFELLDRCMEKVF